jgi:hypothetical protein
MGDAALADFETQQGAVALVAAPNAEVVDGREDVEVLRS